MKQKNLGLTAILLAISFSAFTKFEKESFEILKFRYTPPGINSYTATAVSNVANWHYNPTSACNSSNVKPCIIYVIEEKYVHTDGLGDHILNDAAYASDPYREFGDVEAVINTEEGSTSGMYIATYGAPGTAWLIVNKVN